jgi:hypothetical protein
MIQTDTGFLAFFAARMFMFGVQLLQQQPFHKSLRGGFA